MVSDRRRVWTTLADLLTRLERDMAARQPAQTELPAGLDTLEKEVRKLGKAQFKANMLAEEQAARLEKVLAELETQPAQQAELLERLTTEKVNAARQDWLESLLPALDGLDNAIASGKRYLAVRDQAATTPDLTPAQALLVSPADRAKLSNWLDGLRIVRERLLAILESGGVTPIPTIGQPFDPYQHVAVATTAEGDGAQGTPLAPGTIVAEDRRGYRTAERVLRYADVVVFRPKEP
ncbi:MAG TPA: nucleotide exchange factor GrpE [Anaerolineae bacterium]|nr:nucleotide exchange factor GrpE [Anaerolineae bacterium]HQH38039.1 nucleotide exchange factor GrpE [Anaerolineae bacterium]